MVIDIISYTEEQFAELTEKQMNKVREAQKKKNKLVDELAKNLKEREQRLFANGTRYSGAWAQWKLQMQEENRREIELVREDLLLFLQYSQQESAGSNGGKPEVTLPYPLDESLTGAQRYEVVKTYYMTAYTDGEKRMEAFKADIVAKDYLGDYYEILYDYLLEIS